MARLRLSGPRQRVDARWHLGDPALLTNRDARARHTPAPRRTASADPTAGWARIVRVAVLGSASLVLAALAHLLGGGALPSLASSLPLLLFAGTVAALVTARRCRLPVLLPILGAGQVLLHLLFEASSRASGAGASTVSAAHTGHELCPAGLAAAAQPPSWLMLAGHVLATALTAWVLARGEAALWRLADLFIRAARPQLTARPASLPGFRVLETPRLLKPFWRSDDAAPRGPPRCLAVAG